MSKRFIVPLTGVDLIRLFQREAEDMGERLSFDGAMSRLHELQVDGDAAGRWDVDKIVARFPDDTKGWWRDAE